MKSKYLPLSLLGCITLGLGAAGCVGGPDSASTTDEPLSSDVPSADVSVPAGVTDPAHAPAAAQHAALTAAPSSDQPGKVPIDAVVGWGGTAFGFPTTWAYFQPWATSYAVPWGGPTAGGFASGISSGISTGVSSGFSSSSGFSTSTATGCGSGLGCW